MGNTNFSLDRHLQFAMRDVFLTFPLAEGLILIVDLFLGFVVGELNWLAIEFSSDVTFLLRHASIE